MMKMAKMASERLGVKSMAFCGAGLEGWAPTRMKHLAAIRARAKGHGGCHDSSNRHTSRFGHHIVMF
jgi:hypothetical protein